LFKGIPVSKGTATKFNDFHQKLPSLFIKSLLSRILPLILDHANQGRSIVNEKCENDENLS
jgi:hypothetical protein